MFADWHQVTEAVVDAHVPNGSVEPSGAPTDLRRGEFTESLGVGYRNPSGEVGRDWTLGTRTVTAGVWQRVVDLGQDGDTGDCGVAPIALQVTDIDPASDAAELDSVATVGRRRSDLHFAEPQHAKTVAAG